MLQDEDEVVEHGLLVEARGPAEVAQEATAGHNHLVRRIFLFGRGFAFSVGLSLGLGLNISLSLRTSACFKSISLKLNVTN